MRVTDHRYNRDRERLDLALRMMGHGARSCTIWTWTRLTADRQRKLFRSYVQTRTPGSIRRRRGKAPRQPSYFFESSETAFEASALAGIFLMQGLLDDPEPGPDDRQSGAALDYATLVCAAYEEHRLRYPNPHISFEYGWFLLKLLREQRHLKLNVCPECRRVYVTERVRMDRLPCGCRLNALKAHRRGRLPKPVIRAIEAGVKLAIE